MQIISCVLCRKSSFQLFDRFSDICNCEQNQKSEYFFFIALFTIEEIMLNKKSTECVSKNCYTVQL